MATLQETLSANYDALAGAETATEKVDTATQPADNKPTEPVAGTPAKVPEKAAKSEAKVSTAAAATPKDRAKAPSSWPAEYHSHFDTIDPRLQELILKREKEASDGISQYGDKLKKLEPLGALEPLLAARRQTWASRGLSDAQGLGRVLETFDQYISNPRQFLEQQARNLGLSFQQPQQEQDPYAEQSREAISPQVQQLFGGLQQRQEQLERFLQEQRNREFLAKISAFSSETDKATGKPLRPHFEAVRPQIEGWFQQILRSEPNLTFEEALAKAYDTATWGHPETRAAILEGQRLEAEEAKAKEQRERDEQGRFTKAQDAKKSAVKGEPPDPEAGKGKKKDLRASLSDKWDQMSRRAAAI